MPKLKNVSSVGDLDVPLLRREVAAGETVEVTEEQARALLTPADHPSPNYAPADDEAQAIQDDMSAEHEAAVREDLGIPAPSALKAEWVEYARRKGDLDPESKTKDQLIAEYGEIPTGEETVE